MPSTPSLDTYKRNFSETDFTYLERHYSRICQTRKMILSGLDGTQLDVIDIGAHWLHQTLLYAMDGHNVTAADLHISMNEPSIKKLAKKNHIKTHSYSDLSCLSAFDGLQSNAFDLILFTEIIEHITFNPVGMWENLYRILKPGGKIIVTTPNYYYLGQTLKRMIRVFKRMGGGINVHDILKLKTMGPHWKEYSSQELKLYFQMLSRDFVIKKMQYTISPKNNQPTMSFKRSLIQNTEKIVPIFRSGLYVEILLPEKNHGIEITPGW